MSKRHPKPEVPQLITIEERHALAMAHLKFMEAVSNANTARAALDKQGAAIFQKYGLDPQRDRLDLDTGAIVRGGKTG